MVVWPTTNYPAAIAGDSYRRAKCRFAIIINRNNFVAYLGKVIGVACPLVNPYSTNTSVISATPNNNSTTISRNSHC